MDPIELKSVGGTTVTVQMDEWGCVMLVLEDRGTGWRQSASLTRSQAHEVAVALVQAAEEARHE